MIWVTLNMGRSAANCQGDVGEFHILWRAVTPTRRVSYVEQMASRTYECLDVYKDSVDSTCDAVDSGIKVHVKHIYSLLAPLLLATSRAYSMGDWCLHVCVLSTFFQSLLLLHFLSDFYEPWHTSSMCQYTKRTVGQIFEILILKFLANFRNVALGLGLCSSSSSRLELSNPTASLVLTCCSLQLPVCVTSSTS